MGAFISSKDGSNDRISPDWHCLIILMGIGVFFGPQLDFLLFSTPAPDLPLKEDISSSGGGSFLTPSSGRRRVVLHTADAFSWLTRNFHGQTKGNKD
mmetsp:Transcript_45693/g.115005  ORF Transcript_45693/g.115005 Transcript_45693/m.115005 type:complete len:97 (-) Transcript_45693:278-568(-)